MNRRKILALGISLGLVFSLTFQVFAAPTIERIQAYVNNEMTFSFNDKKVPLSDEYEVIVYKDRSYVPVRFLSENLGATVDWNNDTKVISISTSQGAVSPTEPAITDPVDKRDYRKLPLFKETLETKMTVSMFLDDKYGYKLSLALENKTDIPIQLDQINTVVIVDGMEHDMKDATITELDSRWYNDIHKDEKTQGYLRLPNTVKDPEKMHIEFKLRNNGNTKLKEDTIVFDIDLTK